MNKYYGGDKMSRTDTLHDGIPFKVEKQKKYNKETLQAIEDVKNGKNLSNAFNRVDEMFEELDK